jgi:hypothetical protein
VIPVVSKEKPAGRVIVCLYLPPPREFQFAAKILPVVPFTDDEGIFAEFTPSWVWSFTCCQFASRAGNTTGPLSFVSGFLNP